jgi:hypothetical protein
MRSNQMQDANVNEKHYPYCEPRNDDRRQLTLKEVLTMRLTLPLRITGFWTLFIHHSGHFLLRKLYASSFVGNELAKHLLSCIRWEQPISITGQQMSVSSHLCLLATDNAVHYIHTKFLLFLSQCLLSIHHEVYSPSRYDRTCSTHYFLSCT